MFLFLSLAVIVVYFGYFYAAYLCFILFSVFLCFILLHGPFLVSRVFGIVYSFSSFFVAL